MIKDDKKKKPFTRNLKLKTTDRVVRKRKVVKDFYKFLRKYTRNWCTMNRTSAWAETSKSLRRNTLLPKPNKGMRKVLQMEKTRTIIIKDWFITRSPSINVPGRIEGNL